MVTTARPCARRCLLAGNAHDLAVMFRLCEMWTGMGGEAPVAAELQAAAASVPSWKFLPLAYQLASRLSRPGRRPDLDKSGFTVRTVPSIAAPACLSPLQFLLAACIISLPPVWSLPALRLHA